MIVFRIGVVVAGVLLSACAATAPRKNAAKSAPPTVDEVAVTALYTRLDAAVQRYEAGEERIAAGELDEGGKETAVALAEMRSAGVQCDTIAGCDEERFFSAFEGLLRRQTPAAREDADGETSEQAATPGEASPLLTDLPQVGRSITLLKGRELGEIIALNGPVKVALEEWLTQYRPNLVQAYINYQYMRYRMWPEYDKAGLPEALLFGMLAKESGGKVHAVSRSGASGPLQFMYATGLRFGLTTVNGFDQRFDPGLSARANAAYLNEQLRSLNNDLELVLAAYNGGEGRMQRIAGGTGGRFWDARVYGALSPETREYVPMVLAAAWLFMHPDRYNLGFPRVDGRPGSVVLKRPATLSELTVCFGQEGGNRDGWFRTLRNLNPSFDPQDVLPVGTRLEVPAVLQAGYAKQCGDGKWATLAQELHAAVAPVVAVARAAAPPTSGARSYRVRKGDTLAAIARRHGCPAPRSIAELNRLRAPHYQIRAGQTLRIPSCAR